MLLQLVFQLAKQVWLRDAIVVDEDQPFPACVRRADVTSGRRTAVFRKRDQRCVDRALEGLHHLMRRRAGSVVHDDHLELIARIVRARDALQAGAEVVRSVIRWDDYGEANTIDPLLPAVGPRSSLAKPMAGRAPIVVRTLHPATMECFTTGLRLLRAAIKNAV